MATVQLPHFIADDQVVKLIYDLSYVVFKSKKEYVKAGSSIVMKRVKPLGVENKGVDNIPTDEIRKLKE